MTRRDNIQQLCNKESIFVQETVCTLFKYFFYLQIVKQAEINFLGLFDWKLSIQHARLQYNYSPLPNAQQPTSQSTISSAICARSHFQLLAVAAKKVRTRVQFLSSDAAGALQKNENTVQALACYYLVARV